MCYVLSIYLHRGIAQDSFSQKRVNCRTFPDPFASLRAPHFSDIAGIVNLSSNNDLRVVRSADHFL